MTPLARHLSRLSRLFRRPPRQDAPPAGVAPFLVVLARLDGDADGQQETALRRALEGRAGLLVRSLPAVVAVDAPGLAPQLAAAAIKARHLLVEEQADVLVWGSSSAAGLRLHFGTASADDNAPGAFLLGNRLELPAGPDGPLADLFYGAALAALEPHNDLQRQLLRPLLSAALPACEAAVRRPPASLSARQQASLITAYGHLAAAAAGAEGEPGLLARAAEAYRAAHKRLPPKDRSAVEEALLMRHLGRVLSAQADKTGEPALMQQAVEAYRHAAQAMPRAEYPVEWALDQNRLGLALYRLDLRTGQTDLLKESFAAFHAALQVFTRAEQPRRWAEVMHNLAQALQVYGDQLRSTEVLEKAVDACRAVLEIRTRTADPLGWAAIQNTLGTALFMLDRHGGGSEHLEAAEEALRASAETYRSLGAAKLAAVAGKNLSHVERLAAERRERKVARPHWADEP